MKSSHMPTKNVEVISQLSNELDISILLELPEIAIIPTRLVKHLYEI
jgi:hypothetical protein